MRPVGHKSAHAEMSNAFDKKKGPASAPTLPDHGSNNPSQKVTAMNKHVDTTASAKTARDCLVADAMRNLEDDICSLLNMARILAELLDQDLVGYEDGKKVQMPDRGKTMKVYLGHDQMECLSFAWNDVINRALRLKTRFYAAYDAGVQA